MGMMTTTVDDLDRRVKALETAQTTNSSTLRWVAGTLGQVQAGVDDNTLQIREVRTIVDGHTARLDKIDGCLNKMDGRLNDHTSRLERVEHEIKGLRADMPGIVAGAMCDVLKGEK